MLRILLPAAALKQSTGLPRHLDFEIFCGGEDKTLVGTDRESACPRTGMLSPDLLGLHSIAGLKTEVLFDAQHTPHEKSGLARTILNSR